MNNKLKNKPKTNPIYRGVASGEAGIYPGVASGEAGTNPIFVPQALFIAYNRRQAPAIS